MVRTVKEIEERCCYLQRNLERYVSKGNLREHSNDIFDLVHDLSLREGFSLRGPRFHVQYLLNLEKVYVSLLTFCEKMVGSGEVPPREIKISMKRD